MPQAQDSERSEIVARAVGGRGARGPPPRGAGRRFLGRYYRHVPVEDLAERDPIDLAGAALSHRAARRVPAAGHRQRAGLHPDGRRVRLDQRAHRRRDRHRRHALPGRLGDHRARPGRTAAIHLLVHPQFVVRRDVTGRCSRSSTVRRRPGRAEHPRDSLVESWIHVEIDRETDPEPARAVQQGVLLGARRRPGGGRGLAEDDAARRGDIAAELAASPPHGLPAEEVAEGRRAAGLARGRPLHVPRVPRLPPGRARRARQAASPQTGTGLGHPAATTSAESSAASTG